jgi:hypothetical protein
MASLGMPQPSASPDQGALLGADANSCAMMHQSHAHRRGEVLARAGA